MYISLAVDGRRSLPQQRNFRADYLASRRRNLPRKVSTRRAMGNREDVIVSVHYRDERALVVLYNYIDISLYRHATLIDARIHHAEDEEGLITAGTLSAEVDGQRRTFRPGETVRLPRGVPHRWWNDGDRPLAFEGYTRPAVDLDRYLQAVFEVVNAGPPHRPPLFSRYPRVPRGQGALRGARVLLNRRQRTLNQRLFACGVGRARTRRCTDRRCGNASWH